MTQIKTEILINAPIEKIWTILTDFSSYKNWNPFIQDIQGQPQLNERLIITIKPPKKKKMIFKPKIISVIDNAELSWIGNLFIPGIFDGQHSFRLKKLSDNKVHLSHSESFSGILKKPIFQLIHESTQQGFDQMNQALKNLCEEKLV